MDRCQDDLVVELGTAVKASDREVGKGGTIRGVLSRAGGGESLGLGLSRRQGGVRGAANLTDGGRLG